MLPQTKLARYARELLKMKLEAAERDGIEAKDCEAFTDLFRDGFVDPAGDERTQEERQPFKRSVRGPKFDPASKTGRIRTRFFELWNGGTDSFYIDDMLDISCDEMQKALYSRIAPSAGARRLHDQHEKRPARPDPLHPGGKESHHYLRGKP